MNNEENASIINLKKAIEKWKKCLGWYCAANSVLYTPDKIYFIEFCKFNKN